MAGKHSNDARLPERLASLKQRQWLRAAEVLGFRVTHGGKHPYVVRDPENFNNGDINSSVTTIPSNLHPVINKKIFHQLCDSPITKRMGLTEDDILKALKLR